MENADTTSLSVNIHGETYQMKVNNDLDRVLQVVALLDEQMQAIADKMPALKYKDIAVLAALNIAEDYFKLRDDYKMLVDLIEEEKR